MVGPTGDDGFANAGALALRKMPAARAKARAWRVVTFLMGVNKTVGWGWEKKTTRCGKADKDDQHT